MFGWLHACLAEWLERQPRFASGTAEGGERGRTGWLRLCALDGQDAINGHATAAINGHATAAYSSPSLACQSSPPVWSLTSGPHL